MKRTVVAVAQDVPLDRENREHREIANRVDGGPQPRRAGPRRRREPPPRRPLDQEGRLLLVAGEACDNGSPTLNQLAKHQGKCSRSPGLIWKKARVCKSALPLQQPVFWARRMHSYARPSTSRTLNKRRGHHLRTVPRSPVMSIVFTSVCNRQTTSSSRAAIPMPRPSQASRASTSRARCAHLTKATSERPMNAPNPLTNSCGHWKTSPCPRRCRHGLVRNLESLVLESNETPSAPIGV